MERAVTLLSEKLHSPIPLISRKEADDFQLQFKTPDITAESSFLHEKLICALRFSFFIISIHIIYFIASK